MPALSYTDKQYQLPLIAFLNGVILSVSSDVRLNQRFGSVLLEYLFRNLSQIHKKFCDGVPKIETSKNLIKK